MSIKRRIYEIIEVAREGDILSRIFDLSIIILIILNIIAVILGTVRNFYISHQVLLRNFEIISVSVFTIEYLLRLWTATYKERFEHPVWGRIKYIFTPMAIIDLLAILPFYLPMLIPMDLRFLRILRLFRIFRLFKMTRYSKAMQTLGNVIKEKKEELLVTVFIVFILLLTASSLMYYVEVDAQPDKFSSILDAMWWGVATLTTVGYGDVYPITPLGKFLGAVISLLGIGLFALPTGILASGFGEEIRKNREKKRTIICPKCGAELEIDLSNFDIKIKNKEGREK